MKMLTAMLVVVALISPAFSQKVTFQGTHPRPKPPIVAPAITPILLHTGKPITVDDKKQLLASAIKAYSAKTPAKYWKVSTASAYTAPIVLTPDNMSVNGVAYGVAQLPLDINYADGVISFLPKSAFAYQGTVSSLYFGITVQANTAYLIIPKVFFTSEDVPYPQFTLLGAFGGPPPAQTFTGNMGSNEFAYAFVSSNSGDVAVEMLSPNSAWQFLSCEITATPLN
jgi:hypothetical protein